MYVPDVYICVADAGHSAQLLALFALMEPGDTIVAATRLYGINLVSL